MESAENNIRGESGQWLPGMSGNPSGRPKTDARISELAREHTEAAVKTLVEIMANKKAPPNTRVNAATALLDRGWGKPAQYVENNITVNSLEEWIGTVLANEAQYQATGLIEDQSNIVTVLPVVETVQPIAAPATQPVEPAMSDWVTRHKEAEQRQQHIFDLEARAMGI